MSTPFVHIKKWCDHSTQMVTIGNHTWSVARLIQLSSGLQIMEFPIKALNIYNTYDKLTLRDMVMHFEAMQQANLKYPIILDEDGDLMDGRHRMMKALYLRRSLIKVVRFDINPSPCSIEESSQ